jgi:F-type H+-transporting ATPase subunit a
MKKAMVLLAVLFTGVAFGQEAEHAAPAHGESYAEQVEEHEVSTADYILHHVSDSTEYEFEVPLSRNHIAIHLPQILVPLKAGGCALDATGHLLPGGSCLDLSITKHTVMMWIAALILIFALMVGSNRNKNKLVPQGASQNLFEMLVLFVRDELAIKNIGKEDGPRYVPYLLTAFFFILFMNLLGLVPWMASATGNIAVTCGLAICTFVVTQVASIRAAGLKGYLAHLTGGDPGPVHQALRPHHPSLRQYAGGAHRHLLPAGPHLHARPPRRGAGERALRHRHLPARALRGLRAGVRVHHAVRALHRHGRRHGPPRAA